MPKIISIANQKGGVGKTTTALNFAAGLQRVGKKVLLVDLDPQSNLSQYLGYEPDGKPTISDLMSAAAAGQTVDVTGCIRTGSEGIDFIPSHISLSSADFFLIQTMNREQVLRRILRSFELAEYNYILIDCLPSLGILLINALAASDSLIIPVQAQKFALDGLDLLLNVYSMVKQNINPTLAVDGILITMADNTNMAHAVEDALADRFKEKVFDTKISRSVEAANSTFAMQSLVSMKHSKLGQEYALAAVELLERGGKHEN